MSYLFQAIKWYATLADDNFPEIGQTYQPAIYVMHPKNVRVLKIPNMHWGSDVLR